MNNSSFCSFFQIIKGFLGRLVLVEVEGYTVIGKLIHYSLNGERSSKHHKPAILVLKNGKQFLLVRGSWTTIKSLEPNKQ
jgi:hypothetical protein